VEVTVTDKTKQILGITATVVHDVVTEGGAVVEDTFDWYAQDADGSIWYLGEDTAEFEGGEIVTREGSFEAGVDGALPGILIPADPEPGMKYRQEYYAGEAEDNGEILSAHAMADAPAVPTGFYLSRHSCEPVFPRPCGRIDSGIGFGVPLTNPV